jgi:tungstate transport system ATP-binding protein
MTKVERHMTTPRDQSPMLNTDSPGACIYQIDELQKEYNGRMVVDIEQLDIRQGEVLALVGPSGSGKSTFLRLLNFLELPTAGRIVYRGQPLEGAVPLAMRRQVTTVFQRPVLLKASVQDNVIYGMGLRAWRTDGRVTDMISRVGLTPLLKAPAHKLSGGEMQRVALARALVIEPAVLLLDEPTANLDPYNVGLIEDIVRQHNRERGTTIVLVTHNVFQARRMADRVGLMLGGRIVEVGETRQFFESPTDPRTAAFVRGDMVY